MNVISQRVSNVLVRYVHSARTIWNETKKQPSALTALPGLLTYFFYIPSNYIRFIPAFNTTQPNPSNQPRPRKPSCHHSLRRVAEKPIKMWVCFSFSSQTLKLKHLFNIKIRSLTRLCLPASTATPLNSVQLNSTQQMHANWKWIPDN